MVSNSDLPEPEIAGGGCHPDWEVPWSAAPRRTWSHLGIRLVTWKTFQYISQICYGHRYICMVYIYGVYVYIYGICIYIYMVYIYIHHIYIYMVYVYVIYIYWPYTHYPWSSYIKLDFIHHVGRWEESMNFHTHIQLYHRMTINHTHSIHNVLTAAQVWTSKLGIRALLVVAMDFIPMLWGELDKSMWYQYEITPEIRLLKACIVLWDVATVSRWTNGTV